MDSESTRGGTFSKGWDFPGGRFSVSGIGATTISFDKVYRRTPAGMSMRHALWMFASGLAVVLGGCIGHGPRTVENPDLEEKIPAIEDVARTHDRSAIPELVRDLECDDSAVRFYAIRGLHALTGETFGYRYYDSEEQRTAAVMRWQHWLATTQERR